jgi:adenylate kinase
MRRKDDEPAAVQNRLDVYAAQTAPVFEWYKKSGTKIAEINAIGSVDDVTDRALAALRGK